MRGGRMKMRKEGRANMGRKGGERNRGGRKKIGREGESI